MNFTGQTALVVGASRGFGRGVVESLRAKKMNAFIAEYASGLASRTKRPIRFHCLIPPMSPHTEFGAAAASAYAQMSGQTFQEFVKQLPSPPSPADIGAAVVALHEDPKKWNQVSYRISAKGLAPVE